MPISIKGKSLHYDDGDVSHGHGPRGAFMTGPDRFPSFIPKPRRNKNKPKPKRGSKEKKKNKKRCKRMKDKQKKKRSSFI